MPGAWNVELKLLSGPTTPESNAPPVAVNVCGAEEALLKTILAPRSTVMDEGLNAKPDAPLTARTEAVIGAGVGAGVGVGVGVGFGVGFGVAGTSAGEDRVAAGCAVGAAVEVAEALAVGDALAA